MTILRSIRAALVAGAALLVAACSNGDSTAPPAIGSVTLSLGGGATSNTIIVGNTLALVAQVKDSKGTTVANPTLTWTSSDEAKATVNASGIVTGVAPGAATITATSGGQSGTIALTVTAGAPAALVKVGGDGQSGVVNSALASPIVVQVNDAKGFGVSGVSVSWVASAGTLGAATATTDAAGRASTTLTLGPTAGAATVTASIAQASATASFAETATWSPVRDDWITYGHDGHRSSAVQTSLAAPLKLAWKYTSTGAPGHALVNVEHAVASADGVFLRSSVNAGYGYGLSPAVEKVSLAGQRAWIYNMGTDADFGNWATISGANVLMNDDGVRWVNTSSGAAVGGGVDSWGEMLSDASGVLFLEQSAQIDGPGVYVAALNPTTRANVWTANSYATCRGSAATVAGGMAYANGTLFYAPAYNAGKTTTVLPFASGVYAFNATTGAKLASVATTPTSRISADNAYVYLIENGNKLVARAQSDLHVVWSQTLPNSSGQQPPVVVAGLVIIATPSDVRAFTTSGTQKWTATMSGAAAYWSSTYQGGNCGTITIPVGSYGSTTTMVAATASNTLIVTASDGIHIVSLATGAEIWRGNPTSSRVSNPVLVNDPAQGPILYVVDYTNLYALKP